jgi:hypothetical protein
MTLDAIGDEILFTSAALAADPDAADLAAPVETWLALIDAARAADRKARHAIAKTDAARVVANDRLDRACAAFGDDLYAAVAKDRTSARWTQFFSMPVSRFVRQALGRQVQTVRGWLAGSKDAVLEQHRAVLEARAADADAALVATKGTALVRGEVHQGREHLAEELTRERDGLRDALAARARERHLAREWADLFFRTEAHAAAPAEADPAATAPAV